MTITKEKGTFSSQNQLVQENFETQTQLPSPLIDNLNFSLTQELTNVAKNGLLFDY